MVRTLPFVAILLAACSAAAPEMGTIRLVLDGDGLIDSATGRAVSFGRAERGALDAAATLLASPPDVRTTRQCDGANVDIAAWRSGFEMQFRGDAFVGWRAFGTPYLRTSTVAPGADAAGLVC